MRCPDCGALNPDEAGWCNQCLRRFQPPPPPPGAGLSEAAPATGTEAPTAGVDPFDSLPTAADAIRAPGEVLEDSERSVVGTERGPFVVTETGVVWRCPSCESINPIDVEICTGCGTLLRSVVAPTEDRRPERDPRLTVFVSLAFPGVGHAYLGMWGQAFARAAIAALAIAAAIAGVTLDAAGSRAMAVIFAFIALAIWGVSVQDAFHEANRKSRSVILKGRMFLYVTLGVVGLLFLQLALGAASQVGG